MNRVADFDDKSRPSGMSGWRERGPYCKIVVCCGAVLIDDDEASSYD